MPRVEIGLWIVLAACGEVSSERPLADAPPTLGQFSAPVKLALGTTGSAYATDPTLTGDEQRLTFVIVSTDPTMTTTLWTDLRAGGPTDWTLGSSEPFSQGDEVTPKISPDGLTIVFSKPDATSLQIRTYRRASRSAPWQPATDL